MKQGGKLLRLSILLFCAFAFLCISLFVYYLFSHRFCSSRCGITLRHRRSISWYYYYYRSYYTRYVSFIYIVTALAWWSTRSCSTWNPFALPLYSSSLCPILFALEHELHLIHREHSFMERWVLLAFRIVDAILWQVDGVNVITVSSNTIAVGNFIG